MDNTFKKIVETFKNIRVLVIGDSMLDRYCTGTANRICREAPVPIVGVEDISEMPGGAANAALNLAALGAHVTFFSIVGLDRDGEILTSSLKRMYVDVSNVIFIPNIPTMAKTRIIAKDQILIRFDIGKEISYSPKIEQKLLQNLVDIYDTIDAVLISDYGYGVITDRIKHMLQQLITIQKKVVVIDAKYPEKYKNFPNTAIKPNYQEALRLFSSTEPPSPKNRVDSILNHREEILANTKSELVAVTLDTEGAVVIQNDGQYIQTTTIPQPDSKAAGAGDTYTAGLLLGLASGASIQQTSHLAARAATVTIKKSATAFCTQQELVDSFYEQEKIIDFALLKNLMPKLQKKDKKIVFTNGCFDILHSGHSKYLHQAKLLGDILIVGINSDISIKKLKGNGRPINTLTERMQVLSALESIDYIIPFEEDNPHNLLRIIQPDIYVKGGDYTKETLPETALVEELGGKVIILPYIPEKSTTHVIEKIGKAYHQI